MIPDAPRPPRPYEDPAWSTYDTETRGRLNMQWRLALTDWWIEGNGLVRLDVYRPGARQCCTECLAGGSLHGEPVQGEDSHGDCAADGEPLWWVVLSEPLPPIATPEQAAAFLLSTGRVDDEPEPLIEDQILVIADDDRRETAYNKAVRNRGADGFIVEHAMEALQVLRRNAKARKDR